MDLKNQDIINNRSCLTKGEIQRYVNKLSVAEERFAIENHLLDCELCDAALEGYIRHADVVYENSSAPQKQNWIYLAAATMLLLVAAVAFRGYKKASQPTATFAEFYQKPSWNTQTRGENESEQYIKAIKTYNQGDYAAALDEFENLIQIHPEDSRLRLYKGIADLEFGNLHRAEEELQTVRINSDTYFEEASWYLALLHVKNKNKIEAIQLLDELLQIEDGFYHQKAEQLKNELQD